MFRVISLKIGSLVDLASDIPYLPYTPDIPYIPDIQDIPYIPEVPYIPDIPYGQHLLKTHFLGSEAPKMCRPISNENTKSISYDRYSFSILDRSVM